MKKFKAKIHQKNRKNTVNLSLACFKQKIPRKHQLKIEKNDKNCFSAKK